MTVTMPRGTNTDNSLPDVAIVDFCNFPVKISSYLHFLYFYGTLTFEPRHYLLFIVFIVSCQQLKGKEHDLALAGLQPRLVYIIGPYTSVLWYPSLSQFGMLVRREGVLRTSVTCPPDRIPHNVSCAIHTVAAQSSYVNTRAYAKE